MTGGQSHHVPNCMFLAVAPVWSPELRTQGDPLVHSHQASHPKMNLFTEHRQTHSREELMVTKEERWGGIN